MTYVAIGNYYNNKGYDVYGFITITITMTYIDIGNYYNNNYYDVHTYRELLQ